MSVQSGELSLPHEEREKELLAIGEHFGLRGGQLDKLNTAALQAEADEATKETLASVKSMTLSVIDGDFPREVLAGQNLTFASYRMPQRRNNPRAYDSKLNAPGPVTQGVLKLGRLVPQQAPVSQVSSAARGVWWSMGAALVLFGVIALGSRRRYCDTNATRNAIPIAIL